MTFRFNARAEADRGFLWKCGSRDVEAASTHGATDVRSSSVHGRAGRHVRGTNLWIIFMLRLSSPTVGIGIDSNSSGHVERDRTWLK